MKQFNYNNNNLNEKKKGLANRSLEQIQRESGS